MCVCVCVKMEKALMLGKKNKFGLARWVTLFALLLTTLVKVYHENSEFQPHLVYKIVNNSLENQDRKIQCYLEGIAKDKLTNDAFSNCLQMNSWSVREVVITKLVLSMTFGKNTVSIDMEGQLRNEALSNVNITRLITRHFQSANFDFLGCWYPMKAISGSCFLVYK